MGQRRKVGEANETCSIFILDLISQSSGEERVPQCWPVIILFTE